MSLTLRNRIENNSRKIGGCWVWQRSFYNSGYPRTSINTKSVSAHRASYEVFKGAIPKDLQIDHLCRNKTCVNPDHLEAVTARINTLRAPNAIATINSLKTHCLRGHEFSIQNTYSRKDRNERMCKKCLAIRAVS